MPIRQTQSYLRSLFAERGIAPQRRLGQNFLVDLNIHDVIIKAAEVGPDDVILEVGSGTGALTSLMAAQGASVVAVDVDPAMAKLTAEAVAGLSNVRVLHRDALAGKHVLDPQVLDAVRSGLAAAPGPAVQAGGEPALQRGDAADHQPAGASRALSGAPGGDDPARAGRSPDRPAGECRLRVRLGAGPALAEVSLVRGLPPSVFWPRPKVDSAVVAIRADADKRARVGDVAWFHHLVRQVFLHRRKYIRHVLAGLWRDEWTKPEVDAWLEAQGLSGQLRAERSTSRNSSRWRTHFAGDFRAPVLRSRAHPTTSRVGNARPTSARREDLGADVLFAGGLPVHVPGVTGLVERVPQRGQFLDGRLGVRPGTIDRPVELLAELPHPHRADQPARGHLEQQGAGAGHGVAPAPRHPRRAASCRGVGRDLGRPGLHRRMAGSRVGDGDRPSRSACP